MTTDPVVTIVRVDEQGAASFEVELDGSDGEVEYHGLTITDNGSWLYEA